jgi:hypothetical protein
MIPAALAMVLAPQVGDFAIAVIPDTQYYSENVAWFPTFLAQTQAIVTARQTEGVVFVTHVGDIVDNGSAITAEWQRADQAMDIIANVPGFAYSAACGNHDYNTVSNKASGATAYIQWFGPARYAGEPWYHASSPDGTSHAQRFFAGGQELLHIALEWRADDEALEWAQAVMAQFPRLPTILSTHEHLGTGNPGNYTTGGATPDGAGDNSAAQVRAKVVEPYGQVFMVLCGHIHGNGRRTGSNAFGGVVHEVLQDFQADPEGGNGWFRVVKFRPSLDTVEFDTRSPVYIPGLSTGPDRNNTPDDNFTLSLDLDALVDDLSSHETLRFRQGQDAGHGSYTGAKDTYIGDGSVGVTQPGANLGQASVVRCDGDADKEQGLLRFDDIVGTASGRIPPGATIERAFLVLTTEGTNADSATGGRLHRMSSTWNEASTWNSLGSGVQLGTEALATADHSTGAVSKTTRTFDVTASVQAWVDGAPNHGWLVQAAGTDRWEFRSSQWAQVAERPMLVVRLAACTPPTSYCTSTPNSFSAGARISHLGGTSLAANDLRLLVDFAPPNRKGIFFVGGTAAQVPFGDGYRCVGGSVQRLGPFIYSNFIGAFERAIDVNSAPFAGTLAPGSARYFQLQFRDPAGPGGSGFNLSDGLRVVFCP